jgi:hypothetical protein
MGILVVYLFTKHRTTRAFGPVQHGDVCRHVPLSATFGMLTQMDATASILAHLTFCFRTSLDKGGHLVGQRLALCACHCHVAGTLLSKTFTRHTN